MFLYFLSLRQIVVHEFLSRFSSFSVHTMKVWVQFPQDLKTSIVDHDKTGF